MKESLEQSRKRSLETRKVLDAAAEEHTPDVTIEAQVGVVADPLEAVAEESLASLVEERRSDEERPVVIEEETSTPKEPTKTFKTKKNKKTKRYYESFETKKDGIFED